jgi:hypothetical protein
MIDEMVRAAPEDAYNWAELTRRATEASATEST